MISNLHVKNYILFDDLVIDFTKPFTIISGETGAGKSILIDAIGILMGEKIIKDIIKQGSEKATIEAVFTNIPPSVKKILDDNDIDSDDDLIIRRDIMMTGRSTYRINGIVSPLSLVETLKVELVDIHSQNEVFKLFQTHNYLDFIDNENVKKELVIYQNYLNDYIADLKDYNDLNRQKEELENQLDYKKYQFNELTKANLTINEYDNLLKEFEVLNNYEHYQNLISELKDCIDDEMLNKLYNAKNLTEKLAKLDEKYQDIFPKIESIYYELDDFKYSFLKNSIGSFDNDRLDYVNERIALLKRLCQKYHTDNDGLIKLRDDLKIELTNFENSDFLIKESLNKVSNSFKKVYDASLVVSALRKSRALELEKEIKNELVKMMLPNVKLKIEFSYNEITSPLDKSAFKKKGIDNVDFLISFNQGENLKPLAKVASGGELSRVMLALKATLAKELNLSTMIFDEIDTGISRSAALRVGEVLKELSTHMQVIAITHLPLVASFAGEHIFISKDDKIKVETLSYQRRIEELAMMLSPESTEPDKVLDIAKELLENNSK